MSLVFFLIWFCGKVEKPYKKSKCYHSFPKFSNNIENEDSHYLDINQLGKASKMHFTYKVLYPLIVF